MVVGVPSNDFGGQEPGTAREIAAFCKINYGVTFPLAAKTVVKGMARIRSTSGRESRPGRRAGRSGTSTIPDRGGRAFDRLVLDPSQAHGTEDQGGGGGGAGL